MSTIPSTIAMPGHTDGQHRQPRSHQHRNTTMTSTQQTQPLIQPRSPIRPGSGAVVGTSADRAPQRTRDPMAQPARASPGLNSFGCSEGSVSGADLRWCRAQSSCDHHPCHVSVVLLCLAWVGRRELCLGLFTSSTQD